MAIHKNISRSAYDALPGLNWSYLKNGVGRTRAHMDAAKANRKDSPAMRFGRIVHLAKLQPSEYAKLATISTKTTTRDDAVTEQERTDVAGMLVSMAALGHPRIVMPETAITWTLGGVECKALIDGVTDDPDAFLVDLKSTQNAELGAFKGEVFKRKYHAQAAYYFDGLRANGVHIQGAALLACEKESPYACGFYPLSDGWLDLGRKCYEEALEVWSDNKPAQYGTQELEVPDWCDGGVTVDDDGGISL